MNKVEILMINGSADGVRIESSLDYPPDAEIERSVQARFNRELGWLQAPDAPPSISSILSIVSQEQAIGVLALTTGRGQDICARRTNWAMIGDMELAAKHRGKGLGVAAVIAALDHMQHGLGTDYEPMYWIGDASRRLFTKLAKLGLTDRPPEEMLWDWLPAEPQPHQRILPVGVTLEPIMRALSLQRAA